MCVCCGVLSIYMHIYIEGIDDRWCDVSDATKPPTTEFFFGGGGPDGVPVGFVSPSVSTLVGLPERH